MATTFGFGEGDENIGKKSKAWKAEGGNAYRVSLAYWPITADGKLDLAAKSPSFTGASTNYIPNVGYIVNKGPEFTKLAGEPPRQRIATIIVVWPTDKKGVPSISRIEAGEYEVVPWVMSGDKYGFLRNIHGEFPFNEHDVTLSCSDTQFQKMTFNPCKDSFLAKFSKGAATNPKVKGIMDSITASVQDIASKINDFVGREMTVQQVREKLAGGGGGGSSPARDTDDATTTGNIDSIVDGLLDS